MIAADFWELLITLGVVLRSDFGGIIIYYVKATSQECWWGKEERRKWSERLWCSR